MLLETDAKLKFSLISELKIYIYTTYLKGFYSRLGLQTSLV